MGCFLEDVDQAAAGMGLGVVGAGAGAAFLEVLPRLTHEDVVGQKNPGRARQLGGRFSLEFQCQLVIGQARRELTELGTDLATVRW